MDANNSKLFHLKRIIMILFCAILFNVCKNNKQESEKINSSAIKISDVNTELPNMYGKDLVEMNCVPCHSLRYIEMQPEMSKKSWEKIVFKMIKNFDAPIKDSLVANQIIEYLYAIRGTK